MLQIRVRVILGSQIWIRIKKREKLELWRLTICRVVEAHPVAAEAHSGAFEDFRPVIVDSHHFDEEADSDRDLHQSERLKGQHPDSHPHQRDTELQHR